MIYLLPILGFSLGFGITYIEKFGLTREQHATIAGASLIVALVGYVVFLVMRTDSRD